MRSTIQLMKLRQRKTHKKEREPSGDWRKYMYMQIKGLLLLNWWLQNRSDLLTRGPPKLLSIDSRHPDFGTELDTLDCTSCRTTDTVHVFYVRAGQKKAEEILSNVVCLMFATWVLRFLKVWIEVGSFINIREYCIRKYAVGVCKMNGIVHYRKANGLNYYWPAKHPDTIILNRVKMKTRAYLLWLRTVESALT